MEPLTYDDLMPLEQYLERRKELFEAHARYLDRYRRVRVGPSVTLVFENRQTLWFRMQELLRISRLTHPERIQRELDAHNLLLPRPGSLQAALLIHVKDQTKLLDELRPWQTLRGEEIRLVLGGVEHQANPVTAPPEHRCFGATHWIELPMQPQHHRELFHSPQPAYLTIDRENYSHRSAYLSQEIRESLADDLLPILDHQAG